ncbi:chitin synthesis regulation, resistance to congo red-domain-containing protein [Microdochium bolleyi]|uniref:Chitin synthesis regulation, resistance to congo red-domain-containing protein n=1 Tax=Microdochium bolleyi TaxID=196109 RepID=A0A136JFD7_9PEZI|nr:chitin synthesis regulation, resistance to congo red-domain-containing protein [Microdochium bolleyi]
MAPHADTFAMLAERQYRNCPYGYGYGGGCRSQWDYYGRWIFAAVAIFVFILILFVWACVNSRRRRKRGVQPMYGTGWMANNNGQYGQHQQNNPGAYHAPPPAYGAQQGQAYPMQNQDTGATFRTADGYYGGGNNQQEGVYGGNTNNKGGPVGGHGTDYAPPPGPPPAHTRS